jgi:hypothetical protein
MGTHAQLQHITQNSNVPSGLISQHIQCRGHGLRTRVITIIDDGVILCLIDFLPSGHVLELGQVFLDLGGVHIQRHTHRNGGGTGDRLRIDQIGWKSKPKKEKNRPSRGSDRAMTDKSEA